MDSTSVTSVKSITYVRRQVLLITSEGYGSWENVVEETLVRAAVVRYLIDHGYSDEAISKEIDVQHRFYGFTWLPTDIEWYKGDVMAIFDRIDVKNLQ